MLKILSRLLLCFLLLQGVSFAGSSNETSLNGKRIQLISNGVARVYISNVPIEDGCTHSTPVLLLNGPNANPIGKEIYSTLLTAKVSGKKVIIQTTGCWSTYSTPVITSMYLLD